jgi:hypothetical protein
VVGGVNEVAWSAEVPAPRPFKTEADVTPTKKWPWKIYFTTLLFLSPRFRMLSL